MSVRRGSVCFFGFFGCFTAPAQQHATRAAVYTALFLCRADESNADTKRHVNFVNYDTLDDVKEEQKDLDGSKCRYIAEQHARACLTPDEGLLQVLKRKEEFKRNKNFSTLSFTLLHFRYIGFLDRIGPSRLLVYPDGRGSQRLHISRRNPLRLTWILGGVDRRLRQRRRRYFLRDSEIRAGRERTSKQQVVPENF